MHRGHAQCHVLCVSSSGHAGLLGRGRKQRSCLPCHGPYDWPPYHPFRPNLPTTHSLGSLSVFIFLLSKKYAHILLLGDTEEQGLVVWPYRCQQELPCNCWGTTCPGGGVYTVILTSLSPWSGMEWSGRSRPPHDKSPAVPRDLHSHGSSNS